MSVTLREWLSANSAKLSDARLAVRKCWGMSIAGSGDFVILSGGAYKAGVGFLMVFMGLLMIIPVVSGVVWVEVMMGVVLAGWVMLCIRWLRAAVWVDSAELVLRGPFRTRRLEWAQVKEARVVPTNWNKIIGVVSVGTVDGRRIKVDGVGSRWGWRGGDSGVCRMVEEINRRAAAAHSGGGS